MRLRVLALSVSLLLAAAPARAQATHLAVIVGLAGEPEHAELFTRWAGTLIDASARLGVEDVIYLAEKPEVDAKRVTGRSTRDEIVKAFDKLATAGEDDVVFVVLIGHGTFDGRVAKFNLPGPDLTPADFEPLLKKIRSRHLVFVNTASASGPFIEALAGPGRTIVTATRTGAERFATLFGGTSPMRSRARTPTRTRTGGSPCSRRSFTRSGKSRPRTSARASWRPSTRC